MGSGYQPIKSGMRLRALVETSIISPKSRDRVGVNYQRLNKQPGRQDKKRLQRPASPLRRGKHAGDGVIGASQDQKLQGEECVRVCVCDHHQSTQQISGAALGGT